MMTDDVEPTETTTLNVHGRAVETQRQSTSTPEVAMVTVTNENAHVPRRFNTHTTDMELELQEEDERHIQCNDVTEQVNYVVIVKYDDRYLKTLPGILRFLQVVCSVIGVICLTSSGVSDGDYLLLPLAWHLRVFIFVSVCGVLISFLLIMLHVTGLLSILPINWALFDFIVYSSLSFMYLFGASLVASAVDYYEKLEHNVSQWTDEQLIVSVVLGYMCLFLYGATAVLGYRRWKGAGQFRRYRLKTQNNQRGSRQSVVV